MQWGQALETAFFGFCFELFREKEKKRKKKKKKGRKKLAYSVGP